MRIFAQYIIYGDVATRFMHIICYSAFVMCYFMNEKAILSIPYHKQEPYGNVKLSFSNAEFEIATK